MKSIAAFAIFGMPLSIWFGVLAFVSFGVTATIAALIMKGKIKLSILWHMRMAKVSLGLMMIHATLAFWLYFL